MHNKFSISNRLIELYTKQSKHAFYQNLHPALLNKLPITFPTGTSKYEQERWTFMQHVYEFSNKAVLDIGANTGFFSIAGALAGAKTVSVFEGQKEHSEFLKLATEYINLNDIISITPSYYDFSISPNRKYDVCFCLNVLHHIGDDFQVQLSRKTDALHNIKHSLSLLSHNIDTMFFQMGYNWKGNTLLPFFKHGHKAEMIEFVKWATNDSWNIEQVGVLDPNSTAYAKLNTFNSQRFDFIGEFANRPLFLLKSK